MRTFGAWMAHMRRARSRADVGRAIGCSREMVRLIELNERTPNVSIAIRAAHFYNTNPWQLLAHFGLVEREPLQWMASQTPPDELPQPRGSTR